MKLIDSAKLEKVEKKGMVMSVAFRTEERNGYVCRIQDRRKEWSCLSHSGQKKGMVMFVAFRTEERNGSVCRIQGSKAASMKLVRPGLYIGNAADAADDDTLRKTGITHILCLAPTLSRGELSAFRPS